jgi:protein TonB
VQVARRIQIAVLLLCLLGCQRSRSRHSEIFVGSILGEPKMIRYVRPVYPDWARKARLEGIVEFIGTVGKDGRVRDLSFVKGPRLLVPYAESAVHQWRYESPTLNGVPVEVKTQIHVPFTSRQ